MPAILVIENDDLELEFLTALATEEMPEFSSVLSAKTGAQALRSAKQNHPEYILMDILLPDMDGIHVVSELRKIVPSSYIVIITACTDFFCVQQALRMRVYDYMLKPVRPKELKNLLWKMREESLQRTNMVSLPGKKQIHSDTAVGEKSDFLEEALHYIHSHLESKLNLEDVAGQVFINAQYFSRVFRREMGVTFTEYVNTLRVKKASDLLANTSYPAYRIANECGFSDPSYFNRIFFKYMNQTPQKYRRIHRGIDKEEEE